jgi:hypothetical protein
MLRCDLCLLLCDRSVLDGSFIAGLKEKKKLQMPLS